MEFTPRNELIEFFAEHATDTHGYKADRMLDRYVVINIQKLPTIPKHNFDFSDDTVHIQGSYYDFDEIDSTIIHLIATRKQLNILQLERDKIDTHKDLLAQSILKKDYDGLPLRLREAIDLLVNEASVNTD